MTKIRIMYWKEIPVQVQAEDESGRVSKQLDERFQQGVDAISMFDGSGGTDDYLTGWQWGDYATTEGTAQEVADALVARINNGFPGDFVARVRKLHEADNRDLQPGAVDHWIDE